MAVSVLCDSGVEPANIMFLNLICAPEGLRYEHTLIKSCRHFAGCVCCFTEPNLFKIQVLLQSPERDLPRRSHHHWGHRQPSPQRQARSYLLKAEGRETKRYDVYHFQVHRPGLGRLRRQILPDRVNGKGQQKSETDPMRFNFTLHSGGKLNT